MRPSSSRTAVKYSSSLRLSSVPRRTLSSRKSSRTASSTLLRAASRRARSTSVPEPKRRSKISLGLISLGIGWLAERQEGWTRRCSCNPSRSRRPSCWRRRRSRGKPGACGRRGARPRDLVGGDADLDVGAVGLARLGPGEEGRHRAGVVAAAVAMGAGLVGREPVQQGEIIPQLAQRLEDRGQLGRQHALRRHPPAGHVHAIGHVEVGHPVRRGLADRRVARGPARLDAICSSQGKAKETPSPLRTVRRVSWWSVRMAGGYFFLEVFDTGSTCDVPRRRRKGSLWTTAKIMVEKRSWPALVASATLSTAGSS
ncbi:hypothetical protein EMGBD4_05850 [Verrucomicrobiota bacterium]|nr:hypothetical protein EMGBD4_05850 [Verrucomicrobiota bacterium]